MEAIYIGHGGPREGDPFGFWGIDDPGATPTPIRCELVEADGGDAATLAIGDVRLHEVPEGDGSTPGTWTANGALRRGELRALQQMLAPLLRDTDPAIQTRAEVLAAMFGRGSRKEVAQRLAQIATNSNRPKSLRLDSLDLLASMIAQEIDR